MATVTPARGLGGAVPAVTAATYEARAGAQSAMGGGVPVAVVVPASHDSWRASRYEPTERAVEEEEVA